MAQMEIRTFACGRADIETVCRISYVARTLFFVWTSNKDECCKVFLGLTISSPLGGAVEQFARSVAPELAPLPHPPPGIPPLLRPTACPRPRVSDLRSDVVAG